MCRLRANFGRLAHSMQNARNVRREGNPVTLTSYSSPERAIPQPSAAKPLSNLRTLRPEGPVNLKNLFSNDAPILRRLWRPPSCGRGLLLFVMHHWRHKCKSRNAGFMLIARGMILQTSRLKAMSNLRNLLFITFLYNPPPQAAITCGAAAAISFSSPISPCHRHSHLLK